MDGAGAGIGAGAETGGLPIGGAAGMLLATRGTGAWMMELHVGQGPVTPAIEDGTVSFTPQAGQAKVRGSCAINDTDIGDFTKIRQSF